MMTRVISIGLVAGLGFSLVGGCGGGKREFGNDAGAAGEAGGATAGRGGSAGAGGKANPVGGGRAGMPDDGSAGALSGAGGMADETAGSDTSGGNSSAGAHQSGGGTGGKAVGAGGAAAGKSGAGGGTAGGAPACNACANGFACSTTTCKTSCSADSDCLADHFCTAGQCRLDALQVGIGYSHACILLADHTINCWGSNKQSQLGTASAGDSATPVPVKLLSNVQYVAVGDGLTFALLNDGTVSFWGTHISAFDSATGVSTTVATQYPTPFEGLSAVKNIAAGGRGNGCATLADGSARCWAQNDMGQLGNGTYDFSASPAVVSGLSGASGIDMGYAFACAPTASAVKCWGNNFNGSIGSYPNSTVNTPQTIGGLSGTVSKLRTGDSFACVLMTSGAIQCWGANSDGQLGNGTSGSTEPIPVTVSGITGVSELTTATAHTCALVTGGVIRCWGQNYDGQVGNGSTASPVTAPTLVQGLGGKAIAVSAGSYTSCAILENGSVKCWGRIVGTDSTDYASVASVW